MEKESLKNADTEISEKNKTKKTQQQQQKKKKKKKKKKLEEPVGQPHLDSHGEGRRNALWVFGSLFPKASFFTFIVTQYYRLE